MLLRSILCCSFFCLFVWKFAGSGKTMAFVWPMLVHIMDQPELAKDDGPIGIICAPTRELAQQIFIETKKFAKRLNLRVAAIYGGKGKYQLSKELRGGAEIIVATPGRLIDMVFSSCASTSSHMHTKIIISR